MPRYWKTPPELYQALDDEFHFDFDPCPFPKPEGFDSLNMEWRQSNYCNPPFRKHDGGGFGPTAWSRKAVQQLQDHGRESVLLLPTSSWVNVLLEGGAELRSMGRVRWHECDTDEPWKSPQPSTLFILRKKS